VNDTMLYTGTLTVVTCPNCAATYAIPERLHDERRRDHKTIYCPFGHTWYYPGKSDVERANARAAAAESHSRWLTDQLEASERSKAALKGHLTRARNKIAAGLCPVGGCTQPFRDVREHIAHEHPTWRVTDPETGEAASL
jgi:hypothetical protein